MFDYQLPIVTPLQLRFTRVYWLYIQLQKQAFK